MKKSICIVLCTVLLIFTSRFIYHEICARATYDGVIVGSLSVGGEKSICFFNPNYVDEYTCISLDNIRLFQNCRLLDAAMDQEGAVFLLITNQKEIRIVKLNTDGIVILPITLTMQLGMSMIVTEENIILDTQQTIFFYDKKGKEMNRYHYPRQYFFMSPYKHGILIQTKSREVLYLTGNSVEHLFTLKKDQYLEGVMSDDELILAEERGELITLDTFGTMRISDHIWISDGYLGRGVLVTMIPRGSGGVHFWENDSSIMDLVREESPEFYRPFIYDRYTRNIRHLPNFTTQVSLSWSKFPYRKAYFNDLELLLDSIDEGVDVFTAQPNFLLPKKK